MRLASFFVLSLALHAVVLVYPFSFAGQQPEGLIPVTILSSERVAGSGARGGSARVQRGGDAKIPHAPPRAVDPIVRSKSSAAAEPPAMPARAAAVADPSMAAVATSAKPAAAVDAATSTSVNSVAGGSDGTLGGADSGLGWSAVGVGQGDGHGDKTAASGFGLAVKQARYRDTPRPAYPESARREGREGRVLLRVLVDAQGRAKQVVISASSGSDALDHAAADAIKGWRFYPAHHGDRAIESWIKIPIEFALANASSW